MRPDEEVSRELIREWAAKAEEDLGTAERLLAAGDPCFHTAIGFHSQQAAEKYLKASLVQHGIEPPKGSRGHDLGYLLVVVGVEPQLAQTVAAATTPNP